MMDLACSDGSEAHSHPIPISYPPRFRCYTKDEFNAGDIKDGYGRPETPPPAVEEAAAAADGAAANGAGRDTRASAEVETMDITVQIGKFGRHGEYEMQVPKLVAISWIINTANERTENEFDLIGIAKIVHNQTDRTLLKVDEQVDDVLTEHEMVVAVLREEANTVKQLSDEEIDAMREAGLAVEDEARLKDLEVRKAEGEKKLAEIEAKLAEQRAAEIKAKQEADKKAKAARIAQRYAEAEAKKAADEQKQLEKEAAEAAEAEIQFQKEYDDAQAAIKTIHDERQKKADEDAKLEVSELGQGRVG